MFKQLFQVSNNRLIAFFSLLFASCYTYEPLYTPNQNVRFIFGIKKAGYGQLAQDWFANTIDPLIPFQYLVYFTYKYLHEHLFYVYHFLFLSLYAFVLLKLVSSLYNINRSHLKFILYAVMVIFIHSGFFKFGLNTSIGWQLHSGLADQYVLGHYFQTAVFGVLLIASIVSFYFKHHYLAVILSTLAAIFHSAYLLSAAVLTLSYIISLMVFDKKILKPLTLGLLALALISPTLIYLFTTFSSSSPELANQAFKIITEFRIPHHSKVAIWILNDMAIFKLIFMSYALWLIRRHQPLFLVLAISFSISIILTLIQVVFNHHALALIAPWRLTAFIMPIALIIILGYWFNYIYEKYDTWFTQRTNGLLKTSLVLLLIIVFSNAWIIKQKFDAKVSRPEYGIMSYIKNNPQLKSIYMIPQHFYDFRMMTGAAAYVDFKNHPYLDEEVIEWFNRHQFANTVYVNPLHEDNIKAMRQQGITHIILPRDQGRDGEGLYQDNYYQLITLHSSDNTI